MTDPSRRPRRAEWLRLGPGIGLAATATLAVFAGCAGPGRGAVTEPARAARLVRGLDRHALVDDGDGGSLRDALRQSLAWLETQPPDRIFVVGPRTVTAAEQAQGLRRVLDLLGGTLTPDEVAGRLLADFDVLASVGGPDGAMLVTGYYEPIVEASPERSAEYATPVLGRPEDLVEVGLESFDPRFRGEKIVGRVEGHRLVPYWRRTEIDAGRLAGRGLELAWARDPVDVFFMEIQGSGTLRFPDGREVRVGYSAANGRPYRAIGRLLIDEGYLSRETVSMQAIRAWLREHPGEQRRVLEYNDSYVFFRRLDGPPVGSLGVPLTPARSVATDARLFPPGALAFLRTERPVRAADGRIGWEPVRRLVLNQDTGGAIRGPGRVDLFWGRGPDAELAAGLMKQPGALYVLVPKVGR